MRNSFKVITLIILLAGLIIGIVLVQKTQVFKGRAYSDALEVTDDDGNILQQENNQINVKTPRVRINIIDQERLKNLAPPQ